MLPPDDDARITIVSISRESLINVLRFVAWHRATGADEIIIFFDDPEDEAIAHIAPLPFITVQRCTAEFWTSIGISPGKRFVKRQNRALTHAYRQVRSGWVGVLDGDELFYDASGDLRPWLDSLAPDIRTVRPRTAEAVAWQDADGGLFYDRKFRIGTALLCYLG